jgi:tRNA threonylcarbamoyladenosine biosynthesis protein TsaE
MEWTFSLDNINTIAKEFWKLMKGKTVFAFHGRMGAGKTTFIHALCDEKGVKDIVGSPTFSLVNEYAYSCDGTPKALFHLDLYRVRNEDEAARAGIEDVLYSGNICLAEWPDKAPGIFPEETIHVFIEITGSGERRIKIDDN